MRFSRRRIGIHAGGGLLALAALAALAAGLATADADVKPYTAAITATPDADSASAGAEAWTGSTPGVRITLTNGSRHQRLGSADITVPAGIVLAPAAPVVQSPATSGSPTVAGGVIRLRNLSLPPGASVSLTISARIPCTPAAGYTWTTRVKQSNNFNGAGNDFVIRSPQPVLATRGACSLAFAADGQPAPAQRATNITADAFLPAGTRPVAVRVLDGAGAPIPWWAAPVTLALSAPDNPFGGTLSGTTTATPSGGVATFLTAGVGPRVDRSYSGYRMTAASPGITGAAPLSARFAIVDSGQRCAASVTCTGTASNPASSATVSALPSAANDLLLLSLGAPDSPALDCPDYVETTDVLAFDLTSLSGGPAGGTKTVAYTVLNPVKRASAYQVCFRVPRPFTARGGVPAVRQSDGTYLGLLPDCARYGPTPPCVKGRSPLKGSGPVVLTVLAPQGDPWLKG